MPTGRDIICIGASAGGLQPLIELVHELPTGLEAAIFVVVHASSDSPGMLPEILRSAGYVPVEVVGDERDIRVGQIYVATPDHHLLIRRGVVRAVRGPRENGFRPAVDPLFRTAARAYGPRTVGVVLSGGQNDGSAGLRAIKSAGGIAIVQDPKTATVPQMPRSALESADVDHVLTPTDIAATLARLAAERVPGGEDAPFADEADPDPAEFPADALRTGKVSGKPSTYSCPQCGGALWERENGDLLQFRCHVGHGFTAEVLLGGKDGELESTLWSALRCLEENASLRRRMATRVRPRWPDLAEKYESQAIDSDEHVATLRKLLVEARNDVVRDREGSRRKRRDRPRVAAGRASIAAGTGRVRK